MATVQECERALLSLTDRFAALEHETRTRHALDRTVTWSVSDLDVVFSVRVSGGAMSPLRRSDPRDGSGPAQIRLTAHSDDLVALADGRLTPTAAWASGRLRVEASVLDLLRLRSLA